MHMHGFSWVARIGVAVCSLLLAQIARADTTCAVPAADVTTAVMLRSGPSTNTAIIGRLEPGQVATIVGEVPYWYRVLLTDDTAGFISKRWTDPAECPEAPLAGQSFQLHAIDVGTGLAVLVVGKDFSLLYDAGSNDDLATGDRNRVVAYLKRFAPDIARLDHVVVSHPHRDHVELLADVFASFEVGDAWNSGAYNEICGYRALLQAIAVEPGIRYHTGTMNYGDETVGLAERCRQPAGTLTIRHGARIDDEPVALGEQASMQFLFVDGSKRSDLNDNSLVVKLTLGNHTVLLTGDAGGGSRGLPSTAPSPNSIEGQLLACCAEQLKSDVLVVGHHGSKTSSRSAFIDAVGAKVFVISSGPTKYSGTMLPDAEIVDFLATRGTVWRTDQEDTACRESETKVGEPADNRPGGCSNIVLTLGGSGIVTQYQPLEP